MLNFNLNFKKGFSQTDRQHTYQFFSYEAEVYSLILSTLLLHWSFLQELKMVYHTYPRFNRQSHHLYTIKETKKFSKHPATSSKKRLRLSCSPVTACIEFEFRISVKQIFENFPLNFPLSLFPVQVISFNPFVPNIHSLYNLKTSENHKVFWLFRGQRKCALGKNGLIVLQNCSRVLLFIPFHAAVLFLYPLKTPILFYTSGFPTFSGGYRKKPETQNGLTSFYLSLS